MIPNSVDTNIAKYDEVIVTWGEPKVRVRGEIYSAELITVTGDWMPKRHIYGHVSLDERIARQICQITLEKFTPSEAVLTTFRFDLGQTTNFGIRKMTSFKREIAQLFPDILPSVIQELVSDYFDADLSPAVLSPSDDIPPIPFKRAINERALHPHFFVFPVGSSRLRVARRTALNVTCALVGAVWAAAGAAMFFR